MTILYIIGFALFLKHIVYVEWLRIDWKWAALEENNKPLFYALKPFGFCSYCTAGQLTFWITLFTNYVNIWHLFGLTATIIILTALIEKLWNTLK